MADVRKLLDWRYDRKVTQKQPAGIFACGIQIPQRTQILTFVGLVGVVGLRFGNAAVAAVANT